jgi:hypothetical protein
LSDDLERVPHRVPRLIDATDGTDGADGADGTDGTDGADDAQVQIHGADQCLPVVKDLRNW